MGVGEGESAVVVVVHASTDEGDEQRATADVRDLLESDQTLGAYDEPLVRDFFEIVDAELNATSGDLSALVRERVALLTVER